MNDENLDNYVNRRVDSVFSMTLNNQERLYKEIVSFIESLSQKEILSDSFYMELQKRVIKIYPNLDKELIQDIARAVKDCAVVSNENLIDQYKVGNVDTNMVLFDVAAIPNISKKGMIYQNASFNKVVKDLSLSIDKYKPLFYNGNISMKQLVDSVLYETAIKSWSIPLMTKAGVRNYSVDSLITREVRNDINKLTLDSYYDTLSNAKVNLVEVSAHNGARPDHFIWQGKVYWVYEDDGIHQPFTVCGYGTVTGLGGANCRHRFKPFFEGISEEPTGVYVDNYEVQQKLRAMEHKYRQLVSKERMLKEAGLDYTAVKVRRIDVSKKSREYAKENDLGIRLYDGRSK